MCSRSGYYDWISLGKPLYKSFNESINQLVLSEYFKDKRQGIVSLKMKIKKNTVPSSQDQPCIVI